MRRGQRRGFVHEMPKQVAEDSVMEQMALSSQNPTAPVGRTSWLVSSLAGPFCVWATVLEVGTLPWPWQTWSPPLYIYSLLEKWDTEQVPLMNEVMLRLGKFLNFFSLLCKMGIQMFTSGSITRATALHDLFLCLYGLAETHRVQQTLINEDIGMKRWHNEKKVN